MEYPTSWQWSAVGLCFESGVQSDLRKVSEQKYAAPSPGIPLRRFEWHPTRIYKKCCEDYRRVTRLIGFSEEPVLSDCALRTQEVFWNMIKKH